MTEEGLINKCNSSIVKYEVVTKNIKWVARSILLSEGLLVCAIADMLGVDLFIESGIYEGKSTEIWGNYFSNIDVIAMDAVIREGVESRLSYLSNLKVMQGDGTIKIPQIVQALANKDKRIGVFIDGPKGEVAVNLAEKLIKKENVKFVAVHDCHKMSFGQVNYTRIALEKHKGGKFFSDSQLFLEKFRCLDEGDIGQLDEEQQFRWYPGRLDLENGTSRDLGSYGPTVGVIL
jgi:hypothetical protein